MYIWVFPGTDCVKVHFSQLTVLKFMLNYVHFRDSFSNRWTIGLKGWCLRVYLWDVIRMWVWVVNKLRLTRVDCTIVGLLIGWRIIIRLIISVILTLPILLTCIVRSLSHVRNTRLITIKGALSCILLIIWLVIFILVIWKHSAIYLRRLLLSWIVNRIQILFNIWIVLTRNVCVCVCSW